MEYSRAEPPSRVFIYKMTTIHMYLTILLTMLRVFVTVSPIPLTRDNVTKRNKNDLKVVKYLVRNGHLNEKLDVRNLSQKLKLTAENTAKTSYTNDEISNGIKNFQNAVGLKVTGELNEKTLKVMETWRRGVSDLTQPFQLKLHHRNRRYSVLHRTKTGTYRIYKWTKTNIVWQIYKPWAGNLTKSKQEEIFDKAFKIWEYASPLRFVKKTSSGGPWPDIDIEFHSGPHGDDNNFDGPGLTLAHAFLPGTSTRDGDIHLDADENWTEKFLYNVAVHEIGHSIGLGHSGYKDSVMFSSYTRTNPITSLHQDDIDGVKKIYGECQTKIDAAIYLANGDLYFLRKDLVWKYDSTADRVYDGYPKKINDEFPSVSGTKIPSDLDCASRYYVNEKNSIDLFFVKGDQVYVYDVVGKKITVKTSAEFWPSRGKVPGIPAKVPVAVSITQYPVGTWIFKDDYAWNYNDDHPRREIRSGYPVNITTSEWNGLPKDVDDGYFDQNSYIYYFFKGTQYYARTFQLPKTKPYVLLQGNIHKKWKGICSAKY